MTPTPKGPARQTSGMPEATGASLRTHFTTPNRRWPKGVAWGAQSPKVVDRLQHRRERQNHHARCGVDAAQQTRTGSHITTEGF